MMGKATHTSYNFDTQMMSQNVFLRLALTQIDSDPHPFSLPAKSLFFCMLITNRRMQHEFRHPLNDNFLKISFGTLTKNELLEKMSLFDVQFS